MSRFRSTLLIALAFATLAACDKVALLAPTGSTVTLNINKTVVPIGGTAEVVAIVVEASGTAPQNGTMVTFSSSFGTMTPFEAPTEGGIARAIFTGTGSGNAKIGAFSGAAKATEIDVKVGGAGAERITVRSEPSTVPQSGGSVTVIANVQDASGGALPNTPVNFSTDNGVLSSNTGTTDASGEARVTLTTSRTSKVTANVGAKSGDFTITALANPTITMSCGTAATQSVGVPVNCTLTPAATPTTPLQNVTINWGDGTGEPPIGAITGATVTSHTYSAPGTYTVVATAIDQNGQRGTSSVALVVLRVLPTISITASASTGSVGVPITFTVTPAATPPQPITGVSVDFGDGGSRNLGVITGATAVSRTFGAEGTYTVTATVTDQSGQRGTASVQVSIGRTVGPTIAFAQAGTIPNKTFTLTATAATGLSIRSVVVTRFSSGEVVFTSSSGGTSVFVYPPAVAGDVLTATVTDSAGNVGTFQLVVTP